MRVTLVPHTHWDREWYEPFDVFAERLVAMMDGLLDLAAAGFPHFHLDGQTAMIDDYLARRPERAGELEAHVREGRLSAGPWVTQMDEFLVSGESHVRNLRMGLERSRELGAEPTVGYLPDQFGHVGRCRGSSATGASGGPSSGGACRRRSSARRSDGARPTVRPRCSASTCRSATPPARA
jgi:alpha-mannosidase